MATKKRTRTSKVKKPVKKVRARAKKPSSPATTPQISMAAPVEAPLTEIGQKLSILEKILADPRYSESEKMLAVKKIAVNGNGNGNGHALIPPPPPPAPLPAAASPIIAPTNLDLPLVATNQIDESSAPPVQTIEEPLPAPQAIDRIKSTLKEEASGKGALAEALRRRAEEHKNGVEAAQAEPHTAPLRVRLVQSVVDIICWRPKARASKSVEPTVASGKAHVAQIVTKYHAGGDEQFSWAMVGVALALVAVVALVYWFWRFLGTVPGLMILYRFEVFAAVLFGATIWLLFFGGRKKRRKLS